MFEYDSVQDSEVDVTRPDDCVRRLVYNLRRWLSHQNETVLAGHPPWMISNEPILDYKLGT